MSLLAKFVKTAGTIADKLNEGVDKAANIASMVSNGIEAQAERFKIASEEALKQTIEESMRSEAELKESDAAQAISTLAAAKRAKLAALEELAEVEAQAQAKGIDLTYDPFASLKQR